MRKLLLSLMVLASLVSCGKDNKVNGPGSNSSAITINDSVATDLGTKINNSAAYFAPAPGRSPMNTAYKYRYMVSTIASAGQNCEEKEGWFGIKYTVCKSSSSNSNVTYRYVSVETADLLNAKKTELANIVNSSYAGGIVNYGSYYQVTSTSGVIYIIDMRAPIQANPVLVRPMTTGEVVSYQGYFQ